MNKLFIDTDDSSVHKYMIRHTLTWKIGQRYISEVNFFLNGDLRAPYVRSKWAKTTATILVCPMVEDGPKWKLAFRYPVSQFSSDFHEIL